MRGKPNTASRVISYVHHQGPQLLIVQDLAQRFADGRLTTEKLLNADDEELYKLLIEVRGIGKVSNSPLSCIR